MSEPEIPAPQLRNAFGWLVLALLFAFLILQATQRTVSDAPEARVARYTTALKAALASYEAGDTPLTGVLRGEPADAGLRKLERETAPRRRTEAVEAAVWTTVRKQLGEPIATEDLAPLRKAKGYELLVEAYTPRKRTKAEAEALAKRLEARGPASKAAAKVVLREAGLPVPKALPPKGTMVAGAFGALLVLGSGFAWMCAVTLGLSGALRPQGPATEVATPAQADGLAMRAAGLLVAFVALSTVGGLLARAGLDERAAQMVAYLPMLALVPLALRGSGVRLGRGTFGRDVVLGLWAFLLELPVTMVAAFVGGRLLKGLPTPTHPASTALSNSPELWTILVTFVGGAVVAPIWEETMFRGLFFPAVRRFAGPILAALATSFLFASIHPQGPVLWAALASVALFSCALAQTTRSLVPSIVMHVAHNAVLLTLAVLVGQIGGR